MSDIFPDIILINDRYLLSVVLALLVFICIIFMNRRKIKHGWLNLKTRRRLKRLGVKQIANFKCQDGLGQHYIIDRLILRPNGISLLLCKCYPGKIFCADRIDDWTQMLGKKSYRFKNPLYDLECQVKAVSAFVPNVPVDGYLFFDHLAEFPKGHPEQVIYLQKIPAQLVCNKKDDVQASVQDGWKKLLLMAQS